MAVTEFTDSLQNILEKLSYENNEIIVMGNFNIDILKYNANSNSATFLDKCMKTYFFPTSLHPVELPPGHKH